ncbi:hypothetical protein KCU67_g15396, partial [Aureobasidium melanogenum]
GSAIENLASFRLDFRPASDLIDFIGIELVDKRPDTPKHKNKIVIPPSDPARRLAHLKLAA